VPEVQLKGVGGRIMRGSRVAALLGPWFATDSPGPRMANVYPQWVQPHPVYWPEDGAGLRVELEIGDGTLKGVCRGVQLEPPMFKVEELR